MAKARMEGLLHPRFVSLEPDSRRLTRLFMLENYDKAAQRWELNRSVKAKPFNEKVLVNNYNAAVTGIKEEIGKLKNVSADHKW